MFCTFEYFYNQSSDSQQTFIAASASPSEVEKVHFSNAKLVKLIS